MLKNRIITGIVLFIVAVLFLIFTPAKLFYYFSGALFIYMGWEWRLLLGDISVFEKRIYFVTYLVLFLAAPFLPVFIVLAIAAVWWIIAVLLIVSYPAGSTVYASGWFFRGVMGIVTLIPAWLALNLIRQSSHGLMLLFYMLFVIWAADTGAFFVGKWKGKHLLAPSVSPKKTWEGFFGGLFLALLIAVLGAELMQVPFRFWLSLLVVALVTAIFSVVGDLTESLLKRQVGLKDIGHYLPGHGGLLDRIDSLTAAAPIFFLGLYLFGLLK